MDDIKMNLTPPSTTSPEHVDYFLRELEMESQWEQKQQADGQPALEQRGDSAPAEHAGPDGELFLRSIHQELDPADGQAGPAADRCARAKALYGAFAEEEAPQPDAAPSAPVLNKKA